MNIFEELGAARVEAFKRDAEQSVFPSVYPVGPIVQSGSDEASGSTCVEWLDRRSMVYVSFGTGSALSVEQTAELAIGLETSGHRFL